MDEFENLENELRELDQVWKEAKTRDEREGIDEGEHNLVVISMELTKSKKTNDLQVHTTFETLDPEPNTRTGHRWDNLSNPVSLGYFKDMLQCMGLEIPESLGELPIIFENAKNRVVRCTVKKNKGTNGRIYTNIYVNGLAD